jgi:hypothetical protein
MSTTTLNQERLRGGQSLLRVLLPFLALFTGLGASQSALAQASFIEPNTVSFISSPTGGTPTTTNYTNRGTATATFPAYQSTDLGKGASFDQATGSLYLSSLRVPIDYNNTANPGVPPDPSDPSDPGIPATPATVINSVVLKYRVYPAGTTSTNLATLAYTNANLTLSSTSGRTAVYRYTGSPIDILNQPNVLGGGTYTVQLLIVANYTSGSSTQDVSDPGTSDGRTATFKVIAPLVTPNGGTTTWISQVNTPSGTNWANPENWTNGVPTRKSDATIPDKAPTTGFTVTPLLSDPNGHYEVRNLTLDGQLNSTRALVRIGQSVANTDPQGATLRVYGDLNNYAGGLLGGVVGSVGVPDSTRNSTVVLARNDGQPQVVRGLLSVTDVRIEGSGVKAIINEIDVLNTFLFFPAATGSGAMVRTAFDNATLDLTTSQNAKLVITSTGTLLGETSNSYVQGVTISERPLSVNTKQTFGNIGLDITPTQPVNGTVKVTRTTGDPLTPPSFASKPQPIKRQYGVTGDINNGNVSDIVFHYLNSTDELNGNPEDNLTIFKTANNGPPYSLIGRTGTVDLINHTVTRLAYNGSINTLTLGDENNPLPVSLTAFNATRSAADVLLTWTTASEQNNKGFEVQVSADGATYHALSFVASKSMNSSLPLTYKYTDTEPGKTGTRYYRLKQVDVDGKSSFSPVRAISFNGALATEGALVAYPNPVNSSDNLGLQLQGGNIINGLAYVKLIDMAGRTVSDQQLQITDSSLSLGNLSALRSGLYMARVTLPDGSIKTVRIQRQ